MKTNIKTQALFLKELGSLLNYGITKRKALYMIMTHYGDGFSYIAKLLKERIEQGHNILSAFESLETTVFSSSIIDLIKDKSKVKPIGEALKDVYDDICIREQMRSLDIQNIFYFSSLVILLSFISIISIKIIPAIELLLVKGWLIANLVIAICAVTVTIDVIKSNRIEKLNLFNLLNLLAKQRINKKGE